MSYDTFTRADTTVKEYFITMSDGVALRVIDFTPSAYNEKSPVVVFIAGWISLIYGWTGVLRVITPRYRTLYVETREKISARLPERPLGEIDFSVARISRDIRELIDTVIGKEQPFYFLGSSLGSTAALEYLAMKDVHKSQLAFMIAPNSEFRFPSWGIPIIKYFPASLYDSVKPVIKWYLRTIRLDKNKEPEQVKKYEGTIDAAEPRRLQMNALTLCNYRLWDKLPHVTSPVIIIGAETDKLHGIRDMQKMVSLMPQARLVMMASNKETHSERAGEFLVEEISQHELLSKR